MGFWATLEEEAELEEGEAAFEDVDDDYANIDPDIALAYIDEKIQNVLGDFQKDFEGGVFAQTLGAKYGAYGSFLPMYQRSPLNSSHPIDSPKVESQRTLRSSCNLPSENSMGASEGSVIQTSGATVATNLHGPHVLKSISGEDSEGPNSIPTAEKVPERDGAPFTEPDNPPVQRKLTVRIKVVRDKGLHGNAAVYSGLGLISPSSSPWNSPEEGRVAHLSSQKVFEESTTSIIKILTSFPVSCDSLVSPLREDLFNLIKSKNEPVDQKTADFYKEKTGNIVGSDCNVETVIRIRGVKEVHSVDKKNPENETHNSSLCLPHLRVGTDTSSGSVGKAPEIRRLEQHMPVKKRGLKDKVKERISTCEVVKDETVRMKDVQDTKHRESRSNSVESFGKCGLKGFKKECLFDQGEDETVQRNKVSSSLSSMHQDKMDKLEDSYIKPKQPLKVASRTCDKVRLTAKSSASKEFPSGGKDKLKRSKINGSFTLKSEGTLRSESVATVKDRKSASRDSNKVHDSHKDLLGRKPYLDGQENPPEKHLIHASGNKAKTVFPHGGTLTDDVPPSNGLMPTTEPTPGVSSVVITEDWVECVRCQTWRLLPPGISADQLPDKWTCSMQTWLPGMNRCDISEDETAQALRTLFHAPVLETQNGLLTDANSSQAHIKGVKQRQMNLGPKFQSEDASHTSNNSGPVLDSYLITNLHQDVMKSINPENMNQSSSETNRVRKSNAKLSQKSVKVIDNCSDGLEENDHEKSRRKMKTERNSDKYEQGVAIKEKTASFDMSHEKTNKKLKRERNSDYDDQGISKRVKVEGPKDMDNLYSSENNENPGKIQSSSRVSFPRKAAPKEKQPDKKEKVKLPISVKRSRDSFPDSVDSGLLDVKTHEATRLFTKTGKLENSGDQFRDTKISVKEIDNDGVFKSGKKLKASESQLKGSSKTGTTDKLKIGNTQTGIPCSSSNIVDKNTKKSQMSKGKLASGFTTEDVTALKGNLGSEQFSTAAPSSSSKISDSGRGRSSYQEVKGSPVESVSSSPMRLSNLRIVSPTRICGMEKDDLKFIKFPSERTRKKLSYVDGAFESIQSGRFMNKIVRNPSFEIPVPEIQETDTNGKDSTAVPVHADVRMVSSDTRTSKRSIASPVDAQGVTHHASKIRMINNTGPSQRYKSRVDPSAHSKESIKSSGSNFERVVDRVSILSSDRKTLQRKKNMRDETEIDQSNRPLVDYLNNPLSDESTVKASTNDDNVSKRISGTRMDSKKFGDVTCQSQSKLKKCDLSEGRVDVLGSVHLETGGEIIPPDVRVRSVKLKVCSNNNESSKSAGKIKSGGPLDIRPLNTSKGGEESTIVESAPSLVLGNSNHDSMKHPLPDQCEDQNLNGPTHSKKDTTVQGASAALTKAEEYRHFGDFSKESGFECNEAYFKAALMYLLGAALVESSNSEGQKGMMNQIQIFDSSAILCKTCALDYEKRQDMATAALAYKCMEVSYMKIVYLKSSCSRRVWHDLQSSLQMIPQSESPSSSASDIDNPNYQIINGKSVFSKGDAPANGNHIITPRDHQNFVRLLDFTKDVNSAMEAARKSQSAFAATAKMMAEQSVKDSIITTVKEVIDFGFQDLEAFVRMVQHAIGAIARLGFGGG